jgi:hypothetical protein
MEERMTTGPATRRLTAWLAQAAVVISTVAVSLGGLASHASADPNQEILHDTGCPATGSQDNQGSVTYALQADGSIHIGGSVASSAHPNTSYQAYLFTNCGSFAYTFNQGIVTTDGNGAASISFDVPAGTFAPGTVVGFQLVNPTNWTCCSAPTDLLTSDLTYSVPGASPFGSNLIVNGNAEAGPGSADGCPVTSIPGWTPHGNFTVVNYDLGTPTTVNTCVNAYASPPSTAGKAPPDHGANLFAGGKYEDSGTGAVVNQGSTVCDPQASPEVSCATQTIDVSGAANAIDAGGVVADLSGWLGGRGAQDDNAVLSATFRGSSNQDLKTITVGPVLDSDRSSVMELLQRSTTRSVPTGTRSIYVLLKMTHVATTYNDGYADSLSLVLRQAITGVSLTVPQADGTTPPGFTQAGLGSLPLTDIPAEVPASPSDAPVGKSPVGKSPVGKSPVGKSPVGKSPVGKSPVGKSPVGKSPVGKSPVGKSPVGKSPVGKSPLSSFILLRPGGWPAVLADTKNFVGATPQSVTWNDLVNDPYALDSDPCTLPELRSDPSPPAACPNAPAVLTLDQIAWSTSPFADLSFLSLLMGGVTWNDVTPPASDPGGWCDEWLQTSHPCSATPSTDLSQTILESEANGASPYLTSLPSRHVSDIADPTKTLFWGVSLIDLNIDGSFLKNVPLSSIPNLSNVVTCAAPVNCATGTLGDAYDAQTVPGNLTTAALNTTATLGDLGTGILGDKTLNAIEIAFMDPRSISWEDVPLGALPWETYPANTPTHFITYDLNFDVNCSDSSGLQATVDLPDGFRYRPGSSALVAANNSTSPTGDPGVNEGGGYSWDLSNQGCEGSGSEHVHLRFQAMPGFTRGTFASSASVGTNAAFVHVGDTAPVTVVSGFTGNGSPGTAASLAASSMSLVHPSLDPQYFTFTANPGDQVQVSLSHQSHDGDLVLYTPQGTGSEQLLSANPPQPISFGKNPLDDPASNLATDVLPPESLQDVPIVSNLSVAGISNFRGTDTDAVTSTVPQGGGPVTYTVQVDWFNHDVGPEPAVLTVRTFGAPDLPPCQPRSFANAGQGVAATSTPAIGANVNTLLLFDQKRIGDAFGSAAATGIRTSLTNLVNTTTIPGVTAQVVNLDSFAAVNTAFAAADGNPCSPANNNTVVRAINDAVASLGTAANANFANIRYVVIVGDEYIVPHGMLRDGTFDGNESGFTGDTFFGPNTNELGGAFAQGYFLSDAPYGTRTPLSVLGQTMYLPQWSVGRLGGSNTTIKAAIDNFVLSNGLADPRATSTDPRTALVTDYDGFSDFGLQAFNTLTGQMGTGNVTRLSGAWTRADYANALFSSRKDVIVQNGHHDQYRMLPGAFNDTSFFPSDLFTTQDVQNGPSMSKRVILSLGCHFGLDFPSGLAPNATGTDAQRLSYWAKAYFDKGAAVLVGNLGYGYFDTSTTAFDERLLGYFVDDFNRYPTLGEALRQAELRYFTTMASYTPYDRKVLQETIMWGFPMTRLPGAPPAPAAPLATPSIGTDPVSGLPSTTVTVAPTFTKTTLGDGTQFYSADDGTQATHPYPILPLVSSSLPAGPNGMVAKGAVPLSLTYADDSPFKAAFANATVDSSTNESAPPFEVGGYPSTLAAIGTALGPDGSFVQRLNVTPGVFRPTGDPTDSPAAGLFRKVTNSQWLVTFGAPGSSSDAPTISLTTAIQQGGSTFFTSNVSHPSGVARVFVMAFRNNGTVDRVELSNGGSGQSWSGGTAGANIFEYWVFAISNAGTSASTTNKAIGYVPQPPPPPPSGNVTLTTNPSSPPAGSNGWFADNVGVSVSPSGDLISIDKNAPATGPRTVSGAGVHIVDAVSPDTGQVVGSIVVPISGGPTITINTPSGNPTYLLNQPVAESYQCADAGAGRATCTDNNPGTNLDTSTVGLHTFTVTATDNAGNSNSASRTYRVIYKFSGFFQPVDNGLLNLANAGRTIPVKWQITDYNNVGVSDPSSFQGLTVSPPASCSGVTDAIETYATSTNSGPQYLGNGNWQLNWQTQASWSGTCRTMTLRLRDGTGASPPTRAYQAADFKFK